MLAIRASGEFPEPYDSELDTTSKPMPAGEAAAKFQVPPGFKVTAFANEPDIRNPIAMNWDSWGRLWVVENFTYSERAKKLDLTLRDRILIFEDTKGDGHFSSRKVFADDLQVATSVEVGHRGVWVMCPPKLIFIPDKNGDDVADSAPEVLLDGFKVPDENYHGFANGLRFGPDGWLYGRCGASAPGEIGIPGSPADTRIPLRGSIWRYHPQRGVFEALASGTTNPWGHDWDENGELFFINTVNGHLWHGITGAHFVRSHTLDPNPRAYGLIDQHADHWHFDTSQDWTKSRDGAANDLGGGHAHVGMMIYQGDNWPPAYLGRLFTLNMHGRRTNQEILTRSGSGYVGSHGADILMAEDKWFRGLDLLTGPDGGVFTQDWSDTGECHDATGVHRGSGRIFKITSGDPKSVGKFNLKKSSIEELVNDQTHANNWWTRQARLELAARSSAGVPTGAEGLREILIHDENPVYQLRALWALSAIGAADDKLLINLLHHSNEHLRTWAIRLLTDSWPLDTVMSQRPAGRPEAVVADSLMAEFSRLAREDPSGLVRLTLASALQRMPITIRPTLAAPLMAHAEDANDHNLPLMIWYGLIPVPANDLAALAADCELPTTRRFIARRLAEDIEKNPAPLNVTLTASAAKSEAFQKDILGGVAEGLAGWSKVKMPDGWPALSVKVAASGDSKLRDLTRNLGLLFGDSRALDEVRRVALDDNEDVSKRASALQSLIENPPADLRVVCEKLLGVASLGRVAVRGLALFDDPAIGTKLAKGYDGFQPIDRPAVIDTLVSRPAYAQSLLDEMASGKIPRADVSAFHARQIRGFNDASITRKLTEVWGELRDSSADKKELIARLKKQLTPDVLASADKSQGRLNFNNLCSACHTLYGQGGKIGPDLTGAGRDNLDYLLDNIADPGAVVGADFRMTVATLNDGRVLNGFISARTERTITLRTMSESVNLEKSAITSLQESPLSVMPEGLFGALNEIQIRDLIAYLMDKNQVPLPNSGK